MEFIPDTLTEEVLDQEVAVVSVIWMQGANHPVIDYVGCNGYEAEGLMRAALKRLAKSNAGAMIFLEEGQEYEDTPDEDEELDDE